VYAPTEKVIARGEDSQNAVNLFRSPIRNSFGLAVFSKWLDAQAETAIAECVKLEMQQAPQKEMDRQKKEDGELEVARQKNIETFRP
jgi:hypothetical protein